MRARIPLGLELWQGASQLTGAPVVCIVTGLQGSKNPKTGHGMLQTWILPALSSPLEAINTGADSAICGTCPLRGLVRDGKNTGRACYVQVRNAPTAIWSAWSRGRYPRYSRREHARLIRGRTIRLGAYGDPVAVPLRQWQRILPLTSGHTGYTHQWRQFAGYRRLLMASVESADDLQRAQELGWRTFRSRLASEPILRGEFACPASKESGKRLTCESCLACDGSGRNSSRASVSIIAHGGIAVLGNYRRTTANKGVNENVSAENYSSRD